jgi:hypothetical protein
MQLAREYAADCLDAAALDVDNNTVAGILRDLATEQRTGNVL